MVLAGLLVLLLASAEGAERAYGAASSLNAASLDALGSARASSDKTADNTLDSAKGVSNASAPVGAVDALAEVRCLERAASYRAWRFRNHATKKATELYNKHVTEATNRAAQTNQQKHEHGSLKQQAEAEHIHAALYKDDTPPQVLLRKTEQGEDSQNWVQTKDKVIDPKANPAFKQLMQCWMGMAKQNPDVHEHFWITAGTLLGATRDSSFLPWDHDMDFAFDGNHYDNVWALMEKANSQIKTREVGRYKPYKPSWKKSDKSCPKATLTAAEVNAAKQHGRKVPRWTHGTGMLDGGPTFMAAQAEEDASVPKECRKFCFYKHLYRAAGKEGFKVAMEGDVPQFADFFPVFGEKDGVTGAISMTQYAGTGPATKAVYSAPVDAVYPTKECVISGVSARCPADAAQLLDARYGKGKWRVSPYTTYDMDKCAWTPREGFDNSAPAEPPSAESQNAKSEPNPSVDIQEFGLLKKDAKKKK